MMIKREKSTVESTKSLQKTHNILLETIYSKCDKQLTNQLQMQKQVLTLRVSSASFCATRPHPQRYHEARQGHKGHFVGSTLYTHGKG